MFEAECNVEQKVKVTMKPRTLGEKDIKLDGPIIIEVVGGFGTYDRIDDTSFYAIPGDEPGDISYMISGDADLGAGIVPISAMFVLHVKGLMASHFDAVIDTPVLK